MVMPDLKDVVRLVPDWSEIDTLLAGLPEQPFREGEATFNDLVTVETHLGPALTGEAIVHFKPTDVLIRRVAALKAHNGEGVVIHGDSPSDQSAKAA